MKFGFDIHGVLDKHPAIYAAMTQALRAGGHEVYVITGSIHTDEEASKLRTWGIEWDHWFSVTQYHMDKGDVEVEWVDGKPWMDADVWNRTKGDYCRDEGINWMVDDSPVYGKHFDEDNVYVLQRDPREQERWEILGAT